MFYAVAAIDQANFNVTVVERKLNITATTKNYTTMMKLMAMSLSEEKDR
ncbi:hypothetical protein [Gelidibacter mesophilus]|nr:hypothetical protein [Gelidibacter mesophilus]